MARAAAPALTSEGAPGGRLQRWERPIVHDDRGGDDPRARARQGVLPAGDRGRAPRRRRPGTASPTSARPAASSATSPRSSAGGWAHRARGLARRARLHAITRPSPRRAPARRAARETIIPCRSRRSRAPCSEPEAMGEPHRAHVGRRHRRRPVLRPGAVARARPPGRARWCSPSWAACSRWRSATPWGACPTLILHESGYRLEWMDDPWRTWPAPAHGCWRSRTARAPT